MQLVTLATFVEQVALVAFVELFTLVIFVDSVMLFSHENALAAFEESTWQVQIMTKKMHPKVSCRR